MSGTPCCNDPKLTITGEPNGDGTAEIMVECESCGDAFVLHRAYPASIKWDDEHDNESDLPVGAAENKLVGTMTYKVMPERELTEEEKGVLRWLAEVHDEIGAGDGGD